MDRYLKERLVGAAVLVAAAVILIPEMLSGPSDEESSAAGREAEGLRTYTIDLQAQKTSPATSDTPTIADAPQGVAQPLPIEPQSAEAGNEVSEIAEPSSASTTVANAPPTAAPPPEQPRATPQPAPSPPVTAPATQAKPGTWSVQVASLDARAKADSAVADLKKRGFAAYVMEFESKGKTLYRVRVGPVADRPAAETLLKQIKPLHPNAVVMQ